MTRAAIGARGGVNWQEEKLWRELANPGFEMTWVRAGVSVTEKTQQGCAKQNNPTYTMSKSIQNADEYWQICRQRRTEMKAYVAQFIAIRQTVTVRIDDT